MAITAPSAAPPSLSFDDDRDDEDDDWKSHPLLADLFDADEDPDRAPRPRPNPLKGRPKGTR